MQRYIECVEILRCAQYDKVRSLWQDTEILRYAQYDKVCSV